MKKGFTLLELMIVIIVVGVLAALALPRLFKLIEGVRAAEAIANIGTIRRAMERCYLMNDNSYTLCKILTDGATTLDIDFPTNNLSSYFSYSARPKGDGYYIITTRTAYKGAAYQGKMVAFGNRVAVKVYDGFVGIPLGDDQTYWSASDIYKPFVPKNN